VRPTLNYEKACDQLKGFRTDKDTTRPLLLKKKPCYFCLKIVFQRNLPSIINAIEKSNR
jgi:hypothetical protein